jgi:hypothetical protein
VDIYLFEAPIAREPDQSEKMGDMAVNSAVGAKPHEVQRRIMLFAVFDCAQELILFEKVAVLNGFRDTRQFLVNDPAGADVQVADLRISHLPVRKADRHSRGQNTCVRILLFERRYV